MSLRAIDLKHLGQDGMICAFLDLEGEPTLIDPGPSTTYTRLREGLAEHGLAVRDLRHVLLTHVHMDHAGSAGHLAADNPELAIHVHLDGLPHMADPSRMIAASRSIWGEAAPLLWGEMKPVPVDALVPWVPDAGTPHPVRGMRAISTPGHIGHHVAYLREADGSLLVGDSLGVVLSYGAPTHPKCPPPAVDLEKWRASLTQIRALGAERAAFTHFGIHADVVPRTHQLEEALGALEGRVLRAVEAGGAEADAVAFRDESRIDLARHLSRDMVTRYLDAFDPVNDWHGMEGYVRHRASTL
jgi:glyoxylase-like metal-dependent hydrolase (beta-lactamase superfamily II)